MNHAGDLEQHLGAQAAGLGQTERFFWHRLRSEYAMSAIRRYPGPQATVLDIGAGAGVFGTHLPQSLPQARYTFVEPLESLSTRLRARFGEASDWSARTDWRSADAAILLDVLEHQEDDVGFLKEITAKLRPGAILVLTCPALQALWSEWDVRLGHYRRYRVGGLRRVLDSAGLDVLDSRYLFQAMVLPGLIRRRQKLSGPEFPSISRPVNEMIYRLGQMEQACLGWVPFGSSVAAVCRVRERG